MKKTLLIALLAVLPLTVAAKTSAPATQTAPSAAAESLAEKLCALMTECAALMNTCTQENVDEQTDKLEALFDKIQESIEALSPEEQENYLEAIDNAAQQMEVAAQKPEAKGYYGSSRLEALLTHPRRKEVETQDLNTASLKALATECAGRLEEMADLLEQCTPTNADETADKLAQKIARLTELKKAAESLPEDVRTDLRLHQEIGEILLVAGLQFEAAVSFVKEKDYFGSEKLKQMIENLPR